MAKRPREESTEHEDRAVKREPSEGGAARPDNDEHLDMPPASGQANGVFDDDDDEANQPLLLKRRRAAGGARTGLECPYLDTITRTVRSPQSCALYSVQYNHTLSANCFHCRGQCKHKQQKNFWACLPFGEELAASACCPSNFMLTQLCTCRTWTSISRSAALCP